MIGRLGGFQRSNLLLLVLPALGLAWFWRLDFLWLEALLLVLILAAVAIAGKRLKWSARPPTGCDALRRASRNTAIACILPAFASIVLRLGLLPWIPIPHPVVPDEFSHIFLAKTFLLGRLANPAHPLWEHFETIHIISQPTFSSMYMAGQAVFLAAGQLLFGNLFWGVVLSTALFCGALTWFLRAYVPPGWALFGGVLAAIRIGAASYWNDSYWGGSAGALGGALVLGAYPRLIQNWRPRTAVVLAVGLVLLANTRPYEGALLSLVIGLALVYSLGRARKAPWKRVVQSVAAAAILLAVSGWVMTRHWKAVTGHAFTLPYQVNQRMYGWPMTLPWLSLPAVEYRHPELALYHDFEAGEHQFTKAPALIPFDITMKSLALWRFFLGTILSAAFLFTNKILKARRTRVVWLAGAAVLVAVLSEQSGYPHYFSPAAPAGFLFVIQGLRYLAHCRLGTARLGPAIVRAVVPALCLLLGTRAAVSLSSRPSTTSNYISWCCTEVSQRDREPVVRKIEAIPGNHLVIITNQLKTYDVMEWVYNEPDIDRARIVFARDMGPEKNQELIRYYTGRRVWRLRVGKDRAIALEPEDGR